MGVVVRAGRGAARERRRQDRVHVVPLAERLAEPGGRGEVPEPAPHGDEPDGLDGVAGPRPEPGAGGGARGGGVDVGLGGDGERGGRAVERVLGLDEPGQVRAVTRPEPRLPHGHAADGERGERAEGRPDRERLVHARAVDGQRVVAGLAALDREPVAERPAADAQQRAERRPVGRGRRRGRRGERGGAVGARGRVGAGEDLEPGVGPEPLGERAALDPAHDDGPDRGQRRPEPDRLAGHPARGHGQPRGRGAVADVAGQEHVRPGRDAGQREPARGVGDRHGRPERDVGAGEGRPGLAVDDEPGHPAPRGRHHDRADDDDGPGRAADVVEPDGLGHAPEEVVGRPPGPAAPHGPVADEGRREHDVDAGPVGDRGERLAGGDAAEHEAGRRRGLGRRRARPERGADDHDEGSTRGCTDRPTAGSLPAGSGRERGGRRSGCGRHRCEPRGPLARGPLPSPGGRGRRRERGDRLTIICLLRGCSVEYVRTRMGLDSSRRAGGVGGNVATLALPTTATPLRPG